MTHTPHDTHPADFAWRWHCPCCNPRPDDPCGCQPTNRPRVTKTTPDTRGRAWLLTRGQHEYRFHQWAWAVEFALTPPENIYRLWDIDNLDRFCIPHPYTKGPQ